MHVSYAYYIDRMYVKDETFIFVINNINEVNINKIIILLCE